MPQAENTGRFIVYMSREAIDKVNEVAKARGFKSGAEYARAVIAADFEEHGEALDFGIDTWGRHSPDKDEPPPEGRQPKQGRKKQVT